MGRRLPTAVTAGRGHQWPRRDRHTWECVESIAVRFSMVMPLAGLECGLDPVDRSEHGVKHADSQCSICTGG